MEVLYKVIVGSRLYGLSTESSDTDFKGIFMPSKHEAIPSMDNIYGLDEFVPKLRAESKDAEANTEEVLYSGMRFLKLFAKGNPTLTELVFADQEYVSEKTDLGLDIIRFVRSHMITGHLSRGYYGYFCDQIKAFEKGSGKYREKRFENRQQDISSGLYDGKMFSHAYRIGMQGVSLFNDGYFNPTMKGEPLKIARDIKACDISRSDAMGIVLGLKDKLKEAVDNHNLPNEIDRVRVNKYMVDVFSKYYSENN